MHRLCYGAFLQSPVWISPQVFAVPLVAIGFEAEFEYASDYLRQFFGVNLTSDEVQEQKAQRDSTLPVISIIHFPKNIDTPTALEELARSDLNSAERIIAWATGDNLTEFAYITVLNKNETYFRMVLPHSRRRLRLGFGNTGEDFQRSVDRLRAASEEDSHFAFAMSMFSDAAHERNALFKICRLFNVLESLAYALKQSDIPSRRAVKIMLGLEGGAMSSIRIDDRDITYDRIEIAGRLRDKFFHGIPFREVDLVEEFRPVFYLINHRPEVIADCLLSDCELALARWANGNSPARKAAQERRK